MGLETTMSLDINMKHRSHDYSLTSAKKCKMQSLEFCQQNNNGNSQRNYNLGHKGWKNSFYTHFAPSHPCAMLTKHFDLTQVCMLLFSNIERGNRGVYSVGGVAIYEFMFLPFSNTTLIYSGDNS